jgi:hypothetical protein
MIDGFSLYFVQNLISNLAGFLGTLHSDGGGAAGSSLVDALFFNFKKSSKGATYLLDFYISFL